VKSLRMTRSLREKNKGAREVEVALSDPSRSACEDYADAWLRKFAPFS
jgi:hypothetical protein